MIDRSLRDNRDADSDEMVLAVGAFLKNRACLLDRATQPEWSDVLDDLGDPDSCIAFEASIERFVARAQGRIAAIAHDLHPDFYSTQFALQCADVLGVPAVGVQHHHAHIVAVMAEHRVQEPVIGLALDGVGLGTDGAAWGGELLAVDGGYVEWRRLGHLRALALPGGDVAAREPWRMAAAALHALGRNNEIAPRYAAAVGAPAAATIALMLERRLNSPPSTGAGRWFDAAAGVLGVSVRQRGEAEAAIALEQLAAAYLDAHPSFGEVGLCGWDDAGVLDFAPLFERLFELADEGGAAIAYGAALFHVALAQSLAAWAADAMARERTSLLALGGGCFANRLLTRELQAAVLARRADARILIPQTVPCGDAGLAFGQAWVALNELRARRSRATRALAETHTGALAREGT